MAACWCRDWGQEDGGERVLGRLAPVGRGKGAAAGSHGEMNWWHMRVGRGAAGGMQTPEKQNTFHLRRIKTASTKQKEATLCRESHCVGVGEGAGAPAPTGAGSSVSVPYCARPRAWGRGLPPARGTSPSTQRGKEKGEGAPEQRDSTVLTHLPAPSPEAMVQAAASLPGELCCCQVLFRARRECACPSSITEPHPSPQPGQQHSWSPKPVKGQVQGTSMLPQSVKANQLCPSLAF